MTSPKRQITVIRGDGIGQEVVDAALNILEAASTPVQWEFCEAGETCFKQGITSGVPKQTLASIQNTKVVLKGPLSTPVGYGERSANVFLRKAFGLFANIRPVKQYPNIPSIFKDVPIDLIVIRENIEDLYAGIEYYHQPGIAQSIKLISDYGCNHINTFAFEYAKATNRKSVHCATKANILKTTEGMMKASFEAVCKQYPDIHPYHLIIDNCAHQLVINPSQFDMIVTTNMNGDIISDLTSGLVGGLGIAPSANIGNDYAMFEAVHGAAPDIAGQSKANPTAMILSAVMMCRYLDFPDHANTIEHALAKTLSDGHMTGDLAKDNALSTEQFTQKVIQNLGHSCPNFQPSSFKKINMPTIHPPQLNTGTCKGVDIIIVSDNAYSDIKSTLDQVAQTHSCKPVTLSNRGKVIEDNSPDQIIPQWFCRFETQSEPYDDQHISALIQDVSKTFHWVQVEKLCTFT
jgi:isocitrate dehydrogenase